MKEWKSDSNLHVCQNSDDQKKSLWTEELIDYLKIGIDTYKEER